MTEPAADMPRLDVVENVVSVLERYRIIAALGGSGLLAALGLNTRVRDWDLTTDASVENVEAALASSTLAHSRVAAGDGRFASRARFSIVGGDHEVDLIVGFAIRSAGRIVKLPTRVTGQWRGLPLGDPVSWELGYRLMGREQRSVMLRTWLGKVDSRPE